MTDVILRKAQYLKDITRKLEVARDRLVKANEQHANTVEIELPSTYEVLSPIIRHLTDLIVDKQIQFNEL